MKFRIAGSEIGPRNRYDHNDGGHQLEHESRHVETECSSVNQPEDDGTDHGTACLSCNAASAGKCAPDKQGRQRNRHHTGSDIDIHRFLTLSQQASGQSCEGVGDAKTDNGCKSRVNGRGADHIRVVACGANRETQSCFQKPGEESDDQSHGDQSHNGFIGTGDGSAFQQRLELGENSLGLVHVQQGGPTHHSNVDAAGRPHPSQQC